MYMYINYKEKHPWLDPSFKMTEQQCMSQYSKSKNINNTFT